MSSDGKKIMNIKDEILQKNITESEWNRNLKN